MITVYRVETPDGYGPFIKSRVFSYDEYNDIEKILTRYRAYVHPAPQDDGISISYEECCGFASEEQLFNWFPPMCLRQLALFGFKVNKYLVDRVKIGTHQAVFNKSRAEKLAA